MIPGKKIRVLVVDDSLLARSMITKGLSAHPRIEIVGFAINTLDARQKIPALNPDVVTMDVEMPGQNGIEFLKEYLPTHPVPMILVSSLNLKVFDALAAGAVDFVRKPDDHQSPEAFLAGLAMNRLIPGTSPLMNRNYVYVYTRNRIRSHADEKRLIDGAELKDWELLGGILSKYVLEGRTKATLWGEAMQEGIFLLVLRKMREIIRYWDKAGR